MNIAFIGTGYVGLVSGVMFAALGHNVICIDNNIDKINNLHQGKLPIYEPELDKYFAKAITSNQLSFSSNYESIADVDAIFIAVGTPSKDNGDADLSYIYSSIDNLKKYIHPNTILIIKSTVPVGTCKFIEEMLKQENISCPVVSNPEFLREGKAVYDFLNPDRIVIGTNSNYAKDLLKEIYNSFISTHIPLVFTDTNTSELIKYASNTFLAMKIAFINEMSEICETVDSNINILSYAVGLDHRIGTEFLQAGLGFGGSCFPKDIKALHSLTRSKGISAKILDAVIDSNQERCGIILTKILNILGNNMEGLQIAFLGLAFKAGTDDIRHSKAIELVNLLQKKGAIIKAYDPICMDNIKENNKNIQCYDSSYDACIDADSIIIATECDEFQKLDFDKIKKLIKSPYIIDLKNILDADSLINKGYKYYCIGRNFTR